MKALFIALITIHGLIHLMGFVKAFNLTAVNQLTQPISRVSGILWMIAAVLFLVALLMFLIRTDIWWIIALAAIVLSQLLIIQNWSDARFGTTANILLLLPVLIAFLNAQPSSFQNRFRVEVQKRLYHGNEPAVVSEKDLEHLPLPVQKYLHFAGAVGKPVIHNFRVVAKGSMRRSPTSKWIDISSRQYNFFDEPARFFYIESKLYGIPFDGLHAYSDNAAMQIRIASLFQVADARGEKMNQSENVTMYAKFNILEIEYNCREYK